MTTRRKYSDLLDNFGMGFARGITVELTGNTLVITAPNERNLRDFLGFRHDPNWGFVKRGSDFNALGNVGGLMLPGGSEALEWNAGHGYAVVCYGTPEEVRETFAFFSTHPDLMLEAA